MAKIFSEAEFVVSKQYKTDNKEVDKFVEKNNNKYYVKVKYSPMQDNAVSQIYAIAKECNAEAILKSIIKQKRMRIRKIN